ncbi:MAG: sensor histidine kinase [Acetatifactor sp.]|nr:sensor histidine kinase [Acetatifactor sp.]
MIKVVRNKKKIKLIDSLLAKVVIYLLLVVSSFVASVSILWCGFAVSQELYWSGTVQDAMQNLDYYPYNDAANAMWSYVRQMDMDGARKYFETKNYDVNILQKTAAPAGKERDRDLIFGTYDGSYAPTRTRDIYITSDRNLKWVTENGQQEYIIENSTYIFRVYIDPALPYQDNMRITQRIMEFLYQQRYTVIWTAVVGSIATILCFLILICTAGNRKQGDSTQLPEIRGIYLDLLATIYLLVLLGILQGAGRVCSVFSSRSIALELIFAAVLGTVIIIWLTLFCYNIVRQIKYGKWWTHTLIYSVTRIIVRFLKFFGKVCAEVIKGIPSVVTTVIIYLMLCVLEALVTAYLLDARADLMWCVEKVVFLPILIYIAICCRRLIAAGEALSLGQLDHKVNTSNMIGKLKTHGESLNNIGLGIAKAVEERIKSERLKTELITNVSHDLKTPLTSIINYSNLICEEQTENEKIKEYSQVLLRQSGSLKNLLENLVEASKATTGNLEVNLVPSEVGVILSQAVGEYQQRLEEKELELIIDQPEEPVRIMADGRHLWRVFDNLLNNICKYAQEHSRVYLNVEQRGREVQIIFRNMSKYALNVSAEDLEERFVRGDRSRHMEGNGLGLSIAKSLIELQEGDMKIVVDGDLFKVILSFKSLDEAELKNISEKHK